MEGQSLFSGKHKKNLINLSSAELAQGVKVNIPDRSCRASPHPVLFYNSKELVKEEYLVIVLNNFFYFFIKIMWVLSRSASLRHF